MEIDLPENHPDGKLLILDMKSWLDPSGNILYQHYEKPMASKQVISARSAHSESSKRAVPISESVRRMVNTSRRLGLDGVLRPGPHQLHGEDEEGRLQGDLPEECHHDRPGRVRQQAEERPGW